MRLVENIPLDTDKVADLISDPADLRLVWPAARYPFDHQQWKAVLDPEQGNVPFLVFDVDELIGHAALRRTAEESVYSINYLYLSPHLRGKDLGTKMVGMLETYARDHLSAKKLILKTQTYNPRAINCYAQCGFQEDNREDTTVMMSKVLSES